MNPSGLGLSDQKEKYLKAYLSLKGRGCVFSLFSNPQLENSVTSMLSHSCSD